MFKCTLSVPANPVFSEVLHMLWKKAKGKVLNLLLIKGCE